MGGNGGLFNTINAGTIDNNKLVGGTAFGARNRNS